MRSVWQGLFLTKWSHSSLLFYTCTSPPKLLQSFRFRWARLRTTRQHSLIWRRYTHPATWDGDIPQCRSPTRWPSTSSLFWEWWLGPFAPFATPQQWRLCCSIVDANLGKTKLTNILKRRLIVPDANSKYPDQLYQLIAAMEEMDRVVCGWEGSSGNIEIKATPCWYWNPIAAVRRILGHPPFKDHPPYPQVKELDSSCEPIYAAMGTADWWRKTQASVLVLSLRLFLVRLSCVWVS